MLRELPGCTAWRSSALRLRVLADRGVRRSGGASCAPLLRATRHRGAHRAHAPPASRTCSWSRRGATTVATNKLTASFRRLRAVARKELRQLVPRPRHVRHDRRHPADADAAVRLRDQLRRAQSRDRRAGPGEHVDVARIHRAAARHAGGATSRYTTELLGRSRPAACARAARAWPS